MYEAYLVLNNQELVGTLDFYVLKTTQESLKKNGLELTIPEILKASLDGNALVMSTLLINSVMRKTKITAEDIFKLREDEIRDDPDNEKLKESFAKMFQYFIDLFEVCFSNEFEMSKKEVEFEDEEDEALKDYDFALMEYMWTTYLHRNDFWEITPKKYIEQIKIFEKHHLKNDNSNIVEL